MWKTLKNILFGVPEEEEECSYTSAHRYATKLVSNLDGLPTEEDKLRSFLKTLVSIAYNDGIRHYQEELLQDIRDWDLVDIKEG